MSHDGPAVELDLIPSHAQGRRWRLDSSYGDAAVDEAAVPDSLEVTREGGV